MFTPLVVIVLWLVSLFIIPGLSCRVKEYTTNDGQCCPLCHADGSTHVSSFNGFERHHLVNIRKITFSSTVVQKDCTLQSGTRCRPCEAGTFMDRPNGLTKCLLCSFCSTVSGLFDKKNCTETSNTVCDALSGYYCRALADHAGCSSAERHSNCASGQRIKVPGTSRNDTVCEDCSPGYFSKEGVNCTAWTMFDQAPFTHATGPSLADTWLMPSSLSPSPFGSPDHILISSYQDGGTHPPYLSFTADQVRQEFRKIKARKAAGLDQLQTP